MVHQSSALDSPRHIFLLFSKMSVQWALLMDCVLSSIASSVFLPEHTSQNREFLLKCELHQSAAGDNNLRSFFILVRARPTQPLQIWEPSPTSLLLEPKKTILETLHSPGAVNHLLAQSMLPTLRHQRIATMMKCYDCVSLMPWISFLEPLRASVKNDSETIRTDTTLDQDCVLKTTVQLCTACMIVLLTTCLNLNTPLAQIAPFRCKIRNWNAGVTLETKLNKHVCQQILVCATPRFQAWSAASWPFQRVEAIVTARVQAQHGPDKASALSSSDILGFWKVLCQSPTWRQSTHIKKPVVCCSCSLLLLCSLLSWSVHREKCLKLVHRSLVSLSLCIRLVVHDHWQLFLFQFLFLILFLGRYWIPRGPPCKRQSLFFFCTDRSHCVFIPSLCVYVPSLQTLRQIHHQLAIIFQWSVGSMACRIPNLAIWTILQYRCNDWLCCAHCCNIRALLFLLYTDFFVSNLFWNSVAYLCVPFAALLLIDPSRNSPFLQHSMLSCSELTLQISKCCSHLRHRISHGQLLGTNSESQGSLICETTAKCFAASTKSHLSWSNKYARCCVNIVHNQTPSSVSPSSVQYWFWSHVTRLFTFEYLNPNVFPCQNLPRSRLYPNQTKFLVLNLPSPQLCHSSPKFPVQIFQNSSPNVHADRYWPQSAVQSCGIFCCSDEKKIHLNLQINFSIHHKILQKFFIHHDGHFSNFSSMVVTFPNYPTFLVIIFGSVLHHMTWKLLNHFHSFEISSIFSSIPLQTSPM